MAAHTGSRARYECDTHGRACLWIEWIASSQHLHLGCCACRKRVANSQQPHHSMALVVPERDNVDTPLSAVSLPALEGRNGGALPEDRRSGCLLLWPIELSHERVKDESQKGLLYAKRADRSGDRALALILVAIHLHQPNRLLQFVGADFNHSKRLKWPHWRRGKFARSCWLNSSCRSYFTSMGSHHLEDMSRAIA